jgi:hypothetical protein
MMVMDSTPHPALLWILLWAVIMPLTAHTSRPDILFSITVDPRLRDSDEGHGILREYTWSAILASVVALSIALAGFYFGAGTPAGIALVSIGVLTQFAGLAYARAIARRKVRRHQVEPSQQREVSMRPRPFRPVGGWLAQAGPFVILASGTALLVFGGPHAKTGEPAALDWESLYRPVTAAALNCLALAVIFNLLGRGVRRVYSTGPAALKEERNLRAILWLALAMEYCIAVALGFSDFLPPKLRTLAHIACIVVSLAMAIVPLYNGHGGWRLHPRTTPATQPPIGDRTPDHCWKAGVYFNPDDPAVFVERRSLVGWTLNFGNPGAWVFLGGILMFIVMVRILGL